MNDQARFGLVGPFVMLISAAIFGYFGFSPTFSHTSATTGQFLLFVPIYEYTLKASAIAFVICAGVTFIRPVIGNLLYSLCGIGCAAGLATAGVMDLLDTQHTVQDPFLVFLFAIIILFVSIASLRDALNAARLSRGGGVTRDNGERERAAQ